MHRAGDDTWLCRCNCGREIEVKHSDLTHQLVKSCGCIKDITGKKYGRLLVVKKAGEKSWLCRCSCGVEIEVQHGDLIGSKIKCCEWCKTEGKTNLAGKRFGRILVLRRIFDDKWLCRRSCGREIEASYDDLIGNKIKSCGCKVRKDFTGKVYGKLTVLRRTGEDVWLCRCSCGNEIVVKYDDLTRQRVKSCGCRKRKSR